MSTQETCILLVSLQAQWILNCDRAPSPDFLRQEEGFRGRPAFARLGTTLTAGGADVPSADFVRAIPATASVPDNEGRALVAGERAYIVASSLDTLIGTHPAFPEATTTEEWMSIFVHEFFHTRQLLAPSFAETFQAMNDGVLDRERLIALYESDARYRELVQREFQLVSNASADARQVLAEWRVLYEERRAYLNALPDGPLLVRADLVYSYVEGVARYVENTFLIDPKHHPAAATVDDPRFTGFKAFEGRGRDGMLNKGLGARYFYALGMYLSLLLDAVAPDWTQRVHEDPELLFGAVFKVLASPHAGIQPHAGG